MALGPARPQGRAACPGEFADAGDRQAHVEIEQIGQLLDRQAFAHRPEIQRLLFRLGGEPIPHQAVFKALPEKFLHPVAAATRFENRPELVLAFEEAQIQGLGIEAEIIAPHGLEGQDRSKLRLGAAQQRDHVIVGAQRAQCRGDFARRRMQPEHGAGDDAKGSFRADEQLLQIVAGIVLQHAVHRRDDGAVGQDRFEPQHLFARHAVADHPDAAGIGGEIAADLAGAARAEIEGEIKSGLARRLLNFL